MGSEANRKNLEHIDETSYTFLAKFLPCLRKVVLRENVGEFPVESYEVSLKEFCMAVDIQCANCTNRNTKLLHLSKKHFIFFGENYQIRSKSLSS